MKLRRGAVESSRFEFARFARRESGFKSQLWPESEVAPEEGEEESPEPEDITSGEAYQEGYRQGYEAALKEGYETGRQEGAKETEEQLTAALEEHFTSLLESLKAGADALATETNGLRAEFEAWLPRAALLISEYVLRRETETNGGAIIEIIKASLAELPGDERAAIRVHPDDYERLTEQPAEVWQTDRLTFSPDPSVSRGGAVVESPSQVIDARLESRLIDAARRILFPQDSNGNGSS